MTNYQPPTLREVLDRGEPLENYVSLHMFADDVLVQHHRRAPRAYRESVIRFAPLAAYEITGGPIDYIRTRQMITENAWQLEVCDNPDLLPRVRAALPADEVANATAARIEPGTLTHLYPWRDLDDVG